MSGGTDHTSVPTPAAREGRGTVRCRWEYQALTKGTWAVESTTANEAQAQMKPGVEQGITMGGGGEMTKETRRNASIAVDNAGMK